MTNDGNELSQRSYFILSIWRQGKKRPFSIWRGCLEASNGQRVYFATLRQLNQLLRQNGWHEDKVEDGISVGMEPPL